MACAVCRTVTDETPKGCKSNGGCQTGGCNKLNAYDWLAEMPVAFAGEDYKYYEVSFQNGGRKAYFKNEKKLSVSSRDWVVVDSAMGYDIGQISLSGELVRLQMRKKKLKDFPPDYKNILRQPTDKDFELLDKAQKREKETMIKARVIARSLNLEMKIGEVEYQADNKKATFYYTADGRVDFRELIIKLAGEFKIKVEMRQIGVRQEAGKIGGIGSCGRELCCSTWLTDFKSVTTGAARYQNLAINIAKLSGQCGRLKCCLNYELDTYLEAFEEFPKAEKLKTAAGTANLQKTDLLKRLMFYTYDKKVNSTFYALSIDNVKEILEMNKNDKKPESLMTYTVTQDIDEEELEFADTVGHISLASLDKNSRKGKGKGKGRGKKKGYWNKNRKKGGGNNPNRNRKN